MKPGEDLLLKLHEQFAENQNHHQQVFIQLLIALFSLFAGYGYVYAHTDPTLPGMEKLIEKTNEIEYFSPIILCLISLVVLAILALLNALLLNLGYGFRRDQFLNMKIRKKYLINGEYESVFGSLYNAGNKTPLSFLPDFFTLFFWFIFGFQVIILGTTFLRIVCSCATHPGLLCISVLLNFVFVILSLILYGVYYLKYKELENGINNKHLDK